MRRLIIVFSVYCIFFAFIPCLAFYCNTSDDKTVIVQKTSNDITLFKVNTQDTENISLTDYITGCVCAYAGKPRNEEVYKALTIIFLTQLQYSENIDKPHLYTVCDDCDCCRSFISIAEAEIAFGKEELRTIRKIAEDYSEYILTFDNKPINALCFLSTDKKTECADDVWGCYIPYLKSVSSPEVAQEKSIRLSYHQVGKILNNTFSEAVLAYDYTEWITKIDRSSSGGIISLDVGGETVNGFEFANAFGLPSTDFTIKIESDFFIFTSIGEGHRVGLSIDGANTLADGGYTYEQILLHYYSGILITN